MSMTFKVFIGPYLLTKKDPKYEGEELFCIRLHENEEVEAYAWLPNYEDESHEFYFSEDKRTGEYNINEKADMAWFWDKYKDVTREFPPGELKWGIITYYS